MYVEGVIRVFGLKIMAYLSYCGSNDVCMMKIKRCNSIKHEEIAMQLSVIDFIFDAIYCVISDA